MIFVRLIIKNHIKLSLNHTNGAANSLWGAGNGQFCHFHILTDGMTDSFIHRLKLRDFCRFSVFVISTIPIRKFPICGIEVSK